MAVLGAAALAGGLAFLVIPKSEVVTGPRVFPADSHDEVNYRRLAAAAFGQSSETQPRDVSEVRRRMAETIKTKRNALNLRNPHTGEEICELASPGNYDVREEGGAVNIYFFDGVARAKPIWSSVEQAGPPAPQ
jgi:hypothetical protein